MVNGPPLRKKNKTTTLSDETHTIPESRAAKNRWDREEGKEKKMQRRVSIGEKVVRSMRQEGLEVRRGTIERVRGGGKKNLKARERGR